MDALFVVPALVSSNVNEKIVPALAKLIERNIAINNYGIFQDAAIKSLGKGGLIGKIKSAVFEDTYILTDNIINENIIFNILNEKEFTDDEIKKAYDENRRAAEEVANKTNFAKNTEAWFDRYQTELRSRDEALRNRIEAQQRQAERDLRRGELDSKNTNTKSEDPMKTQADIRKSEADIRKSEEELKILKKSQKQAGKVFGADLSYDPKKTMASIDQLELPKNITFFNQISLEPTIIEIPLKIGTPGNSKDFIENEKLIRIGIKCVPYKISSASSLIKLLKVSKLLTDVSFTSYMARYFNLIIRKIWQRIPFTKTRDLYKGGQINPDRARDAVIYSPNSRELTAKFLSNNFKKPGSSPWSTMIILSSFDFKNEPELLDIIKNYRQTTKYVIGDLVITNETKETAYFCGVKLGNCQEFSFEYLKKLLNLTNIIDASASTRHRSSAFAFMKGRSNKSFNAAVMESVDPVKYINDILN